jgi:anti-anti-sigma factor
MSINISKQGDNATIKLGTRFDFDLVQKFREAYSNTDDIKHISIDFRDTEYMDSSGLGMLINMQRSLEKQITKIKLINCRPQVKKVLLISRFDKYFEIS